jgi:hypothetical protein
MQQLLTLADLENGGPIADEVMGFAELAAQGPSAWPPLVPFATLIGRELRGEKSERPSLMYRHAGLARLPSNPWESFHHPLSLRGMVTALSLSLLLFLSCLAILC